MAVELLYIVFTERGINPLGIRFGIGPKLTYGFEIRGSSSKGEDDVVRNNTVKLDPVKNKLWIELLESQSLLWPPPPPTLAPKANLPKGLEDWYAEVDGEVSGI